MPRSHQEIPLPVFPQGADVGGGKPGAGFKQGKPLFLQPVQAPGSSGPQRPGAVLENRGDMIGTEPPGSGVDLEFFLLLFGQPPSFSPDPEILLPVQAERPDPVPG